MTTGQLPRVTHILEAVGLGPDFTGVPESTLEYARIRGQAVHDAIEAEVYGYGDDAELAPDVLVRLDAYRKFAKDAGFTPTHAEITVVNAAWRYVGHPDIAGWLGGTNRAILDFKNTDVVQMGPASWQLAAYRAAWNSERPHEPVDVIAVVQLKSDGTYRFLEVDIAAAEPVWFSALTVYHARQELLRHAA